MEVFDGSRYAGQTPQPRAHPWKLEDDFLGHERRRDWRAAGRAGSESPRHGRLYASACHVPHCQKQSRMPPAVAAIRRREDRAVRHDVRLFAYTVESDRVVHHVDLSWNETWSGTEQVRFCNVDEHMLTYTSPPAQNPFDGREIVHEVTWVRERRPAE